jgi:hypothetical protein
MSSPKAAMVTASITGMDRVCECCCRPPLLPREGGPDDGAAKDWGGKAGGVGCRCGGCGGCGTAGLTANDGSWCKKDAKWSWLLPVVLPLLMGGLNTELLVLVGEVITTTVLGVRRWPWPSTGC